MTPGFGSPSAATDQRAVRLEKIAKSYGATVAVDLDLLEIAEGEFLTLLGPSGCGKTTLLMILAGFVHPDRGRLLVGARDITGLPPEQRNIGMVFQGYALFPHLDVRNNVAFPLRRRRMEKARIAERVEEVLRMVRLEASGGKLPRQLSGGQQQRVALARAIVFEPDLVLLDEPLSALDAGLRQDLQVELKALHRETGATFVCVTHDQDEALSMSDRIAVMRQGRIMQLATPRELYNRPRSRFVAEFMGAKNLIRLQVLAVEGDIAQCLAGDLRLSQKVDPGQVEPGRSITVALRPADLTLGRELANRIEGSVEAQNFHGSDVLLTLLTPLGTLTVACPARRLEQVPARGERLAVGWSAEAGVIVEEE